MREWILGAATCLALASGAGAVELNSDGLHAAPWIEETFKDLREDLDDANAAGQRLMLIVEQRGCIYCERMHEEVFVVPDIETSLGEDFYVVRLDLYGGVEVTDFDGEVLTEKAATRKWGLNFTPTMLFLPEAVPEGATAETAAIATVPGAFEADTVRHMFSWVLAHGYEGDETFQEYHSRLLRAGE